MTFLKASHSQPSAPRSARLVLLGGFLGAGKTTMAVALAERWRSRGLRVGVIANDQGSELVDSATYASRGLTTREVTGGCFCCRFDDFLASADALVDAHRPDILLAEPIGSCTDLRATVLNPLLRLYPGRFRVAPFLVVVDPFRVMEVFEAAGRSALPAKIAYIFRLQQEEASAIVISKIDRLSSEVRERVAAILRERLPGVPQIQASAQSGEGLDAVEGMLLGESPTDNRPAVAIDYDTYAQAESALAWVNLSLRAEGREDLPIDDVALELVTALQRMLAQGGFTIAHGKIAAEAASGLAVANSVANTSEPQLSQVTGARAAVLRVLVNVRAVGDPAGLAREAERAVVQWLVERHFEAAVLKREAFSPARPAPTYRMA